MKSIEKIGLVTASLPLLLGVTGCAATTEQAPKPTINAEYLADTPRTTIKLGEIAYIRSIDPESQIGETILDATEGDIVDEVYPAKGTTTDTKAPTITKTPSRYAAQVTLSGGKSNYLDNDKACDVLNLPEDAQSVTAIALGGETNSTSIAWPVDASGEPLHQIDVCYHQQMEPQDGVVIYYQ